jgi:hypothetical protein
MHLGVSIIRMEDGYLFSCTGPGKKEEDEESSHYGKKLPEHLYPLVLIFLFDDKYFCFIITSLTSFSQDCLSAACSYVPPNALSILNIVFSPSRVVIDLLKVC